MTILVIPDLHGRTWWKTLKLNLFDKVIFLGDYVDSFTVESSVILDNFKEIVNYKIKYPDLIELLIGNHDAQYFLEGTELMSLAKCSGFRQDYLYNIKAVYDDNKDLFKVAYLLNKKYLFTHAGLTKTAYDNTYKSYHKKINIDTPIDEALNTLWNIKIPAILDVPYARGGYSPYGGILWADYSEFTKKTLLPGYHQFAGHNQLKYQHTIIKNVNTSITFLDTGKDNNGFVLEI